MPDSGIPRRAFLRSGALGAVGVTFSDPGRSLSIQPSAQDGGAPMSARGPAGGERAVQSVRDHFPRLSEETFLNAAGGIPLGSFAEAGLDRYRDFARLGPAEGRGAYVNEMLGGIRGRFAALIGAEADDISLIQCTKAGEQIVIDSLPQIWNGGNIVTNDLHFLGSLHNLTGLQRRGVDVRIVKSEGRDIPLEQMLDAIDENTVLVTISLVSNINGRVEPVRELARAAHEHGALLFADIIQAAGIVPIDVRLMEIDAASCSGYKWLYGVHGAGFLYVRPALRGTVLGRGRAPGQARHNYAPWVKQADPEHGDFIFNERADGRHFEPGHISYLGFSALYEGLGFVETVGVEASLNRSVALAERLYEQVDPDLYECITPDRAVSPIITFRATEGADPAALRETLAREGVVVSLFGPHIRVSPALYNMESEIDALAEILNGATG